jgi:hypothetical protein
MLPRAGLPLALLLALTAVGPARPCNVPVFRYALERWTPDDYAVTVFHRGPLTPEQQRRVEQIRKFGRADGGKANLHVEQADVARELEKPLAPLWQTHREAALPRVVVQEPNPEEGTAWQSLALDADAPFLKLTDSPVRRKVAEHLLRGEAIVWLLLEGGDAKANTDAAELLEKTSAKLAKELKLPEGIGEADSKLHSPLPLKISFATVRVSRTDPAETGLVSLLGHIFTDAAKAAGPVVVPIFGRGRALDIVAGDDLTVETLTDAAVFLTGRCSCQVKKLNPGVDLLFAADWESIFEGNTTDPARPSQEVPLAAFPEVPEPESVMCGVPASTGLLPRVLLWSLAGGGMTLVFGTILLLLRWRGGAA